MLKDMGSWRFDRGHILRWWAGRGSRLARVSVWMVFWLLIMTLAWPGALPVVQAAQEESLASPLTLREGESRTVILREVRRVAVGDPDIAEVRVISDDSILVNGKKTGTTNLIYWLKDASRSLPLVVLPRNDELFWKEFWREAGWPGVRAKSLGNAVVLEGNVRTKEEEQRVLSIARAVNPNVVSSLSVVAEGEGASRIPESVVTALTQAVNDPRIRIYGLGGKVVLEGSVSDKDHAERAARLAGALGYTVVNLIQVAPPAQETPRPLLVQVRVVETHHEFLRDLGLDWQAGVQFQQGDLPTLLGLLQEWQVSRLWQKLDLMASTGQGRVLAEPTLVALPGEPASFLSGGQIPVPFQSGPEGARIEWKDYGIKLSLKIRGVDADSAILELQPELSTLDWNNGVQFAGATIPALRTRSAQTAVRLPFDGALVLAGLLNSEQRGQVRGLPSLKDLPLIGGLFGTRSAATNQNELVFILRISRTIPEPKETELPEHPWLRSDGWSTNGEGGDR